MCLYINSSFLHLFRYLLVDETLQISQILVYPQPHLGHSSFILCPSLLGNLTTTVQHHVLFVGVAIVLDLEVAIEPLVASLEAGIIVIEESALEAGLLAEMVGVEAFYFEETELLTVVVEELKHFRLGLLLLLLGTHHSTTQLN